jgi:hypothetical protein
MFAGLYALYSGLVLIVAAGVLGSGILISTPGSLRQTSWSSAKLHPRFTTGRA